MELVVSVRLFGARHHKVGYYCCPAVKAVSRLGREPQCHVTSWLETSIARPFIIFLTNPCELTSKLIHPGKILLD